MKWHAHSLLAGCCGCALAVIPAPPGGAVSVGQRLPDPPGRTTNGDSVNTAEWAQNELVVWYLYDPADPEFAEAARWLAPPFEGRHDFRAVAVPLGAGGESVSPHLPVLAGGARWKVQLGPNLRPPILMVTRPPGIVAALVEGEDAAPQSLALAMLSLHMQREDWAAVREVVERAGPPLVDPTFLAARAYAALAAGDMTVAQDAANGLAQLGPNRGFKAVGQALLAAIALEQQDGARAQSAAEAGGAQAEALAMRAQVALTAGNLAAARTFADPAADAAPQLPWARGAHHVLAAHVALLQGRLSDADRAARAAMQTAPGSWRAWQTLGLVLLQRGDAAGHELLETAAAIGPPEGTQPIAQAARRALAERTASHPDLLIVLETGSVPHTAWPGAGPSAALRLADALQTTGVGTVEVHGLSPAGFTGGEMLDLAAAQQTARRRGARYLALFRLQATARGVMLNVRVIAPQSGGLRGLDSMTWTPDLTLEAACRELAARVRARLKPAR